MLNSKNVPLLSQTECMLGAIALNSNFPSFTFFPVGTVATLLQLPNKQLAVLMRSSKFSSWRHGRLDCALPIAIAYFI
ncbi:MAG: hypothetical protein KME01_16410 [Chroococcus sp. CMT-3BRIN-NPC107]|nr:hypothetical protein [Chroococcus sp. CMT-3BRIN-NPC107]